MNITSYAEFQSLLPQRVQDWITEKHSCINTDHYWWGCIYRCLDNDMDAIGIYASARYFSGFCSQGDGACFDGHITSFEKFFAQPDFAKFEAIKENLASAKWASCGTYCHEHTLSFDINLEYGPCEDRFDNPVRYQVARITYEEAEAQFDEFEGALVEFIKERCRQFYRDLEAEHDSLQETEAIVDTLIANDMLTEELIEQAFGACGLEIPDVHA